MLYHNINQILISTMTNILPKYKMNENTNNPSRLILTVYYYYIIFLRMKEGY